MLFRSPEGTIIEYTQDALQRTSTSDEWKRFECDDIMILMTSLRSEYSRENVRRTMVCDAGRLSLNFPHGIEIPAMNGGFGWALIVTFEQRVSIAFCEWAYRGFWTDGFARLGIDIPSFLAVLTTMLLLFPRTR